MNLDFFLLQTAQLDKSINFWLSFSDNVITGTYKFVVLMVKILLELALALSALAADKTQYFVQLTFNSALQLVNGISNNLAL